MEKNKAMAAFGLLAAMMMDQSTNLRKGSPTPNNEVIQEKQPVKKVIPNGCKEYYFLSSGEFVHENPAYAYSVDFHCIAANDKSAKRKYSNFKQLHQ